MTAIGSHCPAVARAVTVVVDVVARPTLRQSQALHRNRTVAHEVRRRLAPVATAPRHRAARGRVKVHRVKAIRPAVKPPLVAKGPVAAAETARVAAAPVATAADGAAAMARPSRQAASVSERPEQGSIGGARLGAVVVTSSQDRVLI